MYGAKMDERAERQHNRKLALAAKGAKISRDEFIKAAVQHRQGREYIYWLLELCGMGRNPFTANALTTSFACGQLNVGQQIQAHLIEVAPASFLQMLTEKEEERLNAARSDADRSDLDDAAD